MEVEEQEIGQDAKTICHNFAGTVVTVSRDLSEAPVVATLNRNHTSIRKSGRQKIIRYLNNFTYSKTIYKKSMQIGTLIRSENQSSTENLLALAIQT